MSGGRASTRGSSWSCWSPDGRRIVFEGWPPGAQGEQGGAGPWTSEIYVMNVNGGAQARLTSNRVADTSPTWSPDGRRFAFVRFQDCMVCPPAASDHSELFAMNADGTGVRRLTRNDIDDASPAWQPISRRAPQPMSGR